MSTVRFNTQFPGYEVLSELGRSNARILKARHLASGELVAIKHFALNTDAETLRRFQRESVIMTGINHPNIVKIREVQLEAELPYIVMELIEGGNLHNLIAGMGHLDVPTTTRLGLQMASAFKAFHPQGIVHRDIKPENILYRHLPSGELHFLLTDFGVARLQEQSNTLTGQSLMTYEYASPEQFNDPKGVGVATDYYSLGVVLYECLNGSVPFAMGDHAGIVTFMNNVLNDPPPTLTITPGGQPLGQFTELLQGLLTKKAVDRLSDPDELTWRLKQAELDYLQAGRVNPSANRRTAAPIITASQPVKSAPRTSAAVSPARGTLPKTAASPTALYVLAAVLFVILLGIGGYYLTRPSADAGPSTNPFTAASTSSPTSSDSDSTVTTQGETVIDSTQIRLAQEAQRREQLRQQVLAAANKLSAQATDYRVGFIGGISDVQITLSNPSPVAFTSVEVLVSYYKEKGGLFKTEKVYFTDVGPNSTPTRSAPDSDRGTKVTCKILGYTLPDMSILTDSSGNTTPTNPLN